MYVFGFHGFWHRAMVVSVRDFPNLALGIGLSTAL
jgi:hypothetical protein